MSQVKKTGPALEQGVWGGGRTKANGSHLTPASDVTKQGPTGDHMDQYRGNAKSQKSTGSQLSAAHQVPSSDSTSVGGSISGHSRNKVAGKSSGSKNTQNPNVTVKKIGPSGSYLK